MPIRSNYSNHFAFFEMRKSILFFCSFLLPPRDVESQLEFAHSGAVFARFYDYSATRTGQHVRSKGLAKALGLIQPSLGLSHLRSASQPTTSRGDLLSHPC